VLSEVRLQQLMEAFATLGETTRRFWQCRFSTQEHGASMEALLVNCRGGSPRQISSKQSTRPRADSKQSVRGGGSKQSARGGGSKQSARDVSTAETKPESERNPVCSEKHCCITIVEDKEGHVAGCVTSHLWGVQNTPYGDLSQGCVFTFHANSPDRLQVAQLTSGDMHKMCCDGNTIGIYGPDDNALFMVASSLKNAYGGKTSGNSGFDFSIKRLEVWSLSRPPGPPIVW